MTNVFPEIICQDGKWFLRLYDASQYDLGFQVLNPNTTEIELPNHPMMNKIWEASSSLLNVYIDDCGANPRRCVETLRSASKAFAGISQLLANKANSLQNEIELNELYAPDDEEPYWNK